MLEDESDICILYVWQKNVAMAINFLIQCHYYSLNFKVLYIFYIFKYLKIDRTTMKTNYRIYVFYIKTIFTTVLYVIRVRHFNTYQNRYFQNFLCK
jgi:hypothetical protein